MCRKRSFGARITVLLTIAVSVCLLSCGDEIDFDIDQEQTEEPLKFIEFVLFPTAPYIDKSYIEKVPEDEVAFRDIDFEPEIDAIQQVYSNFIKAYIAKDMQTLSKTLDRARGIEYGTSTVTVYGWNNIKIYIEVNWGISHCRSGRRKNSSKTWVLADYHWVLTDFYIRPKNVKVFWAEASATGPMFYYHPDMPLAPNACYVEIGRFYFTKKSDEWRIHQIDGSKYFNDDTYNVP